MNTQYEPEAYNPYKHHGSHHETHQRINQVNSQIGAPAVLNWVERDEMAEAMADATFYGRISYLDDHPDAQALAMKTIHSYRDSLKAGPDGLMGDRANVIGEGHLFALLEVNPSYAIALNSNLTWKDVANQHLSIRYRTCDVDKTYGCNPTGGNQVLAVKVGEFICLYKCCQRCREWFDEPVELRANLEKSTWFDELDRR